MIVCNRTGRDDESHMAGAESVIVDRGEKLLTLRAPDSTVFVVECVLSDGHVERCEVVASLRLASHSRVSDHRDHV